MLLHFNYTAPRCMCIAIQLLCLWPNVLLSVDNNIIIYALTEMSHYEA